MRISIARQEMLEVLSVASRGLSSRSTLPILSGILVTANNDGTVTFNSTDLEIAIKCSTTALVEQPGTVVIPGKLTFDIVRSLPEEKITLSVDGESATILCGQASFTIRVLRADDFPRFPELGAEKRTVLPVKILADIIGHVNRAVSKDETRPILTGVLLVLNGATLHMAATDSYRLSVKETILEEVSGELEVVIPGKALEEVVKLSAAEKEIKIGVTDNQIVFEMGETVFVTRRLEGTFPNYKQLIPREFETHVTVAHDELTNAIKRVSLLAQHNVPLRLSISVEEKRLSLSATTQDIGAASEDIMADVTGRDVEIAFNHVFLSDGIAAAAGNTITLEIVSPLKPGVVKSPEDEGFMYLLMPVRLS